MSASRGRWFAATVGLALILGVAATAATGETAPAGKDKSAAEHDEGHGEKHDKHSSRLSDEHIPLQLEGFPERPKLLLELGNPYLGTGNIKPGVKLPTGAVWQPTLIVFGTLRTGLQSFDSGPTRFSEVATRLDLFANLQLTGTERLVVGLRPFDQDGRFTSYVFDPDPDDPAFQARFGDDDELREELNAEIQTLYFEGDFGEIFPNADKNDFKRLDYGFSVGRQPLLFQEGMLINDSIDGVGITRNTLLPAKTSNFRATFFAGVDDVNRANFEDEEAELYALLTSTDTRKSTIDADLVYVDADELSGDLAVYGVSAVQRLGRFATSFRLLGSLALDEETAFATDGTLVFGEVSWVPHYTYDHAYFTFFAAVDEFSSAARGPATGGPLGRAGINFAAVGLGNYGAALSSRARDVAGGAFGYQKFFGSDQRRQLLTEVGLRLGLDDRVADEAAVTVRYQKAVGRRMVLVLDGFGGRRQGRFGGEEDESLFGGRLEVVFKF